MAKEVSVGREEGLKRKPLDFLSFRGNALEGSE